MGEDPERKRFVAGTWRLTFRRRRRYKMGIRPLAKEPVRC